jgi:hypothetical protein
MRAGCAKALAYLAKVSVSSQYLLFWAISFLFVVRKYTNIIFEKQGNYCFFLEVTRKRLFHRECRLHVPFAVSHPVANARCGVRRHQECRNNLADIAVDA